MKLKSSGLSALHAYRSGLVHRGALQGRTFSLVEAMNSSFSIRQTSNISHLRSHLARPRPERYYILYCASSSQL
jgi:hypothetical protein